MDVLLNESEMLSLPCFDLVRAGTGDRVVAHWGGQRSDLPERFPEGLGGAFKHRQHFLSIDQSLFESLGLKGRMPLTLSIDTTTEDREELSTVNVSTGNLSEVEFKGSVPLTAKPATSLPPLEAILLYGGRAVEEWLAARGLHRWQYSEIPPQACEQYLNYYNARLPLLMKQPPFARIGGWHVQWSDDDFYIPREMRLMVWTFQDAEPWYEVFLSPLMNYIIKSRIT